MNRVLQSRDLVLGISPFEEPNAALAVAVERAGATGVIGLGGDQKRNQVELAQAGAWWPGTFGVRIPAGCPTGPDQLPDRVDVVVLGVGSSCDPADFGPARRVLVEVTSLAEAREAAAGAGLPIAGLPIAGLPIAGLPIAGLIAKGSESGGRIGETTAFVLLQQLLADPTFNVPIWSAGGIGLHTAAAAIAGGAAGVVLDAQLALVRESDLSHEVRTAIAAMDGSETTVVGGHRVFTRPDLPATEHAPLGARDLRAQLLPIGQDGAFARSLAERYPTAGALVAAVRQSIADHLTSAVATRPLAAGSALAAARGLTYPVAQGPMTRVSDRAAFALAVSEAGGLPFLALALMGGDEVRTLLEQTAVLLRGRPWGVGILGFVPAELRETQLAVVHDIRPPCALIAGGRPSQAAPLEAAGIDTFLHVPSPGLLDRFLRDGSRKFVFEGRECGGHVGPRSSFALWESQIERLLAFADSKGDKGDLTGTHVLFAGGIHDEASAAMVAAMAAPLTERGAGVGVLMGTAYLFTEEAVASGAIVAGFQAAALSCDSTVLLETSPGHATRCVDTEYVQSFRAAKEHMEAAGATQQEMWGELEQLNLGRLRLASKGLRREGGTLQAVGEDEQRRQGMVMIGEVATLRSATTTVSALHTQVSEGATEFLEARATELGVTTTGTTPDEAHPLDIAIVGLAGMFAGAPDTDRFWANIVGGVDAVTEVPAERWNVDTYYDPSSVTTGAGARTPSKWGGFLPDIPFDALSYGVPPSSLIGIDPAQLLALEVASRALADAGYASRRFDRDRTSVIFGAEAGTDLAGAYGFRALHQTYVGPLPAELDEHLPSLNEDSFPGVLSNVIAGRIANRLDLGGVNYTVDAACASSLAALDLACKELRTGSSDMVLCGGADVHNGLQDYLLFASVHALSPTGRCRTFDAKADGIALGEGVACVVLKRLADAERDGDRVYAVVKAIAGSSDGRSLGLTAPRPEGQRRALERAYRSAGVSPAEVGLVEAHGTGTVVGDRTELATLTELFIDAGAATGSCALGSVKSQIGHTKCAAGLAGIIKVARALHTGVRPPTGQLSEPNGYWDGDTSPFFFDAAARPWATPPAQRFAGVSAFGFGGTNFHAVLSGYQGGPGPEHGLDEWPAELFAFRGADRAAATKAVDQLIELCAVNDAAGRPWKLRDLAWTVAAGSAGSQAPVQLALVADDLDDLAAKLRLARAIDTGGPTPGPRSLFVAPAETAPAGATSDRPQVAFLFPGQGSQSPGMLADLFVAFPRLRRFLELGGPATGASLAGTMFPPAAFTREGNDRQRAAITDTRVAQPALGVAGLAMNELLAGFGIRPDLAGGHSYGELIALTAAGAIEETDLVGISQARAAAILGAAGNEPGTMAAVAATLPAVTSALATIPDVVIANHNAPNQVVISGAVEAVESAMARLRDLGISAKRIPVACAFHSPLVAGAAGTLAAELDRRRFGHASIPVWSNTTAEPYPTDATAVRRTLAHQVAAPVRFVDQVEAMYAAGARVFVEAGPGRVLTSLVGKILGDRPHVAVACDAPGEPGLRRLLLALAELAAAGVAVDTEPLFRGRHVRLASATDVPRRPGWLVNGQLVRTADGACLPGGLQPATAVPEARPAVAALASERDATVLEFLRSTRQLVAAQRDVMLGYLGATGESLPGLGAAPAVAPAVVVATAKPIAAVSLPAPTGPLTRAQILDAVMAIVSERTGYPRDMLDPGLDLEADLSIDSIKRTEILGELAERVGLTGADGASLDESMVEELARLKTLNAIADWVAARAGAPAEPAPTPLAATPAAMSPSRARARRHVLELEPLPLLPDTPADLGGRRYVIVDGGLGIGLELSELLEQRGAQVRILGPDQTEFEDDLAALDGAHGLVHLAAVDPDQSSVLPHAFSVLREAAQRGVTRLLVATGAGGRFGSEGDPDQLDRLDAGLGLGGLVRTMRAEYPDLLSQLVDVDPKKRPAAIAASLLAELTTAEPPVVVGYARGGVRTGRRVVAADLDRRSSTPAQEVAEAAAALRLDPDSVVLLTGGARGITSKVATQLARATGCHIELIGRTQAPVGEEHPATAGAPDAAAIRRALISSGVRVPSQIEVTTARLLATREIRACLADLSATAASARYHSVDVRDEVAVRAVVEDIYARHGRLDGVVHGAGVLEDKRMSDKGMESFERVFRTKVDGARNLVGALRPDLGFMVLFGSVAGVFGNRGQADYAAANDALDSLAAMWAGRFAGRVVAVDWGPWAGAGMVSAELEREYARRGVGLISVDDGVACLLGELAWGSPEVSQVVYYMQPSDA